MNVNSWIYLCQKCGFIWLYILISISRHSSKSTGFWEMKCHFSLGALTFVWGHAKFQTSKRVPMHWWEKGARSGSQFHLSIQHLLTFLIPCSPCAHSLFISAQGYSHSHPILLSSGDSPPLPGLSWEWGKGSALFMLHWDQDAHLIKLLGLICHTPDRQFPPEPFTPKELEPRN